MVLVTYLATSAADGPCEIGEKMSKSGNAPSTPDRFNPTTLTLPEDLRNRLAAHRQRFENAAVPKNNFRIEVAKYVDRECPQEHRRRLFLEMEPLPSGLDPPGITVDRWAAWKAEGGDAEELVLLAGPLPAVERFTMLAEAATACLPLELRPERPFHSFDSSTERLSFSNVGSWIEFVFHALFTSGHAGAFAIEIDWPKPGCEITTLKVHPFLASVLAVRSRHKRPCIAEPAPDALQVPLCAECDRFLFHVIGPPVGCAARSKGTRIALAGVEATDDQPNASQTQ